MNIRIFISIILLAFCFNSFAKTYQGTLRVLIYDYLPEKKSETAYELHQGKDKFRLNLPKNIDKSKLVTGAKVTVEGNPTALLPSSTNTNTSSQTIEIQVDSINVEQTLNFNAAPVTDVRRILNLLVDFNDKKASRTMSVSDLATIMFDPAISVKTNFEHSSFDQISFNPDTNLNGQPDVYQVNLPYSIGTNCDFEQYATDAKAAAAALGVDLSLYQHFNFVLPNDANCPFNGLAVVGCKGFNCHAWLRSTIAAEPYFGRQIFAHEDGHLLGMHHSAVDPDNAGNTKDEYGDDTCFMGSTNYWKEVNVAHRDQLNWFAAYPQSLKTITQSGQYVLTPLESGVAGNGVLALKFAKPDTSQSWYLSYRKNIGPFGPGTSPAVNKISVHKAAPGISKTFRVKTLGVGETFVDTTNKITMNVVSMDDKSATVQVSFNSVGTTNVLKAWKFYNADNTAEVGYSDWNPNFWKGNCPPYGETVGLSVNPTQGISNSIACLIKNSSNSTASGTFSEAFAIYKGDMRKFARNGDWDAGYFKLECNLNEYISGFSQNKTTYKLNKIRCAKGNFTNGGQNMCETRTLRKNEDRGSSVGDDWDVGNYKAQCSDNKIIFGVSININTFMPHKILCCQK